MIRNIDDCPYSEKDGEYGGASGLKEGLIIDGENWLVKYPKNAMNLSRHEEMEYTNDPVSEYLGSHIYEILGFPVHETMLAERKGKIVVACKDFIGKDERLVEIRTLKNSANNKMAEQLERSFDSTDSSHCIDFEEILLHLKYNRILNQIEGVNKRFYDQIVVDAFINNSDRNNGNWGILRSPNETDRLAPIYDNGGSFNGKTPDSRLAKMLDAHGVDANIRNGISVYGKNRINYQCKDLLLFNIQELKISLKNIVPVIRDNMTDIILFIENIDEKACSNVRKEFYKESLQRRLELMLLPAYKKAMEDNREIAKNDLFDALQANKYVNSEKNKYEIELD